MPSLNERYRKTDSEKELSLTHNDGGAGSGCGGALLCLLGEREVGSASRRRGKDEGPVSGCLLMVRSVVSSTASTLSPVAPGPLHITGHNSPRLAVWGLRGAG